MDPVDYLEELMDLPSTKHACMHSTTFYYCHRGKYFSLMMKAQLVPSKHQK